MCTPFNALWCKDITYITIAFVAMFGVDQFTQRNSGWIVLSGFCLAKLMFYAIASGVRKLFDSHKDFNSIVKHLALRWRDLVRFCWYFNEYHIIIIKSSSSWTSTCRWLPGTILRGMNRSRKGRYFVDHSELPQRNVLRMNFLLTRTVDFFSSFTKDGLLSEEGFLSSSPSESLVKSVKFIFALFTFAFFAYSGQASKGTLEFFRNVTKTPEYLVPIIRMQGTWWYFYLLWFVPCRCCLLLRLEWWDDRVLFPCVRGVPKEKGAASAEYRQTGIIFINNKQSNFKLVRKDARWRWPIFVWWN